MNVEMNKCIEFLAKQLKAIRYGEISPGVINTLRIDVYGQNFTIEQLCWTFADKGRIVVQPYDVSNISTINQAIVKFGYSSYVSSKIQITINLPPRSGEDREKAIQQVKRIGEETKVSIRNIRKSYRKKTNLNDAIQDITDKFINRIEILIRDKIESL